MYKHKGAISRKLSVVDRSRVTDPRQIFFDDDIELDPENPKTVVDLCNDPSRSQCLPSCHVVKAEPLEFLSDRTHFIWHVERLEQECEEYMRDTA